MPIIDCYGELGPQPYPTLATQADSFERLMARFRVDMTFVVATEAMRGSMQAGNAWLAEQIKERPKFRGYCVLHPLMFEASLEEMRKYLFTEKFVGAILHEGYVNRPLFSAPMYQLVKGMLRYDRPLLLRITDSRQLTDLQELAREFHTQRFIVLHMADELWPMILLVAGKLLNISLETGGMVADFDKLAEAYNVMGANRLVFGSGMPLVNPVYALGMVSDSAIPDEDKKRILYNNAVKVYNLPV